MWGKRVAVGLWLALAFVTWNVVFDRAVWRAAADFTRDNVERHERGAPLPTLDEAYRPAVTQAAVTASAWAVSVLVVGAAAINAAGRLRPSTPLRAAPSEAEGRRPDVLP